MYHLSFLLFVAMAAITTALPIPTPEDAYIKSEIQRALPGWVGTGAGLGSTLAIPVFGHNPVLAAAAFPAGAAFGGALGGVGATAYGTLAGTVKRGMSEESSRIAPQLLSLGAYLLNFVPIRCSTQSPLCRRRSRSEKNKRRGKTILARWPWGRFSGWNALTPFARLAEVSLECVVEKSGWFWYWSCLWPPGSHSDGQDTASD